MRDRLFRAGLFTLLVVSIGLAVLNRDRLDVAALEAWIGQAGPVGPILFILVYALATVLFLPGSALTLAGGALFGPLWGTLYNLVGATLGATLAFVLARYLAGGYVERRAGGRLRQLKQGVESEGWRFVAFARLVPLLPFNLLNYALGLTRIPFFPYLLASAVFMVPGALAYTYLGYAGREAIAGTEGIIHKGLLALALLAGVAFLPRLVARLRRGATLSIGSLKSRLDRHEDMLVVDVRTPEDFVGVQGHIPGARNVPLEVLTERSAELAAYLERPIALVCHTDRRSSVAARRLSSQGFADVHIVVGGMKAWNQAGWPTER